ncbi:hypothetical protein FQN53_002509 [Emmonsiellopsis sp. PD_33]|nr:hypothetical protein FQN53_002509 [Emmonsiellopsis sp. PD_33]
MAVSKASALVDGHSDHPHPTGESGIPRHRRTSSGLDRDSAAGERGKATGVSNGAAGSSTTTLSNGHARQPNKYKKPSKRRKARSVLRRFRRFAVKHTWTIPLLLLLVFVSLYAANPTESNIIHHFLFLSYKTPASSPERYGKGLWDLAFVAFYIILLSFTREFIMQELLRPLAQRCGIKPRGKQLRFMEQMYTAIYFGIMGPAGIYVMWQTPELWYFNTRGMYEAFPHRTHEAAFKFYYLFQAAYWAQQAIVMMLGMEKPRKDFKELIAHHVVTLALIALSYRFHFTYMGLAVYVTHDVSDFFLATSKSLHYMNSPLIGLYFGTSIFAWIYLRHYLNLRIIFSLFTEFRTVGPYELDWATQQYKCFLSNVITFALLAALQALNIFWLFCLLRSAYRFVVHNVAKDDRSEGEEEEGEGEGVGEGVGEGKAKVGGEDMGVLNGNGHANGVVKGVGI